MQELLAGLVAILIPFIARYVFEGLQKALAPLDGLAEPLKQLLFFVITFGILQLSLLSGLELPGDIHGWGPETIMALLQWAAGLGIHAFAKQQAAARGAR